MSAAPRQRAEERRLLEWCRLQGVVLDGVKLDGRRLVATRDLAVGHCAISVPKAAVLSTDQAMASDVGQRILAQPDLLVLQDIERQRRLWLAGARHLDLAQAAVTRRSVLYAYLIHLRGSGGRWGAYADALPKSYGSPFTWEPSELGTDLRAEVSKWRQHLDGQYAALFPALSVAEPTMFPAEVFTREAWMWAHLSYETRCFPKGGAGSGSGEVEEEDEDGVLVPLVDMLNHDHGRCQAIAATPTSHHPPPTLTLALALALALAPAAARWAGRVEPRRWVARGGCVCMWRCVAARSCSIATARNPMPSSSGYAPPPRRPSHTARTALLAAVDLSAACRTEPHSAAQCRVGACRVPRVRLRTLCINNPHPNPHQYGFAQFDNPSETVPLCAARLSALLRRTAPRRVASTRLASLSAAFLLLDQDR